MKVLMFYASPWHNGNISAMLDCIAEEMIERGWTVDVEYVDSLDVHPCVGCMKCRADKECCLGRDDAHRIAGKLGEYDLYVIGAPCYWGNMPGALLKTPRNWSFVVARGNIYHLLTCVSLRAKAP